MSNIHDSTPITEEGVQGCISKFNIQRKLTVCRKMQNLEIRTRKVSQTIKNSEVKPPEMSQTKISEVWDTLSLTSRLKATVFDLIRLGSG
jgi:hypothetical protein